MTKLIGIIFLLVAGSYGLSHAGYLPQSVYSHVFGIITPLSGEKGPFDGTWVAHAESAIEETEEAFCGTAMGEFIVQGKRMYGSVHNEFGNTFMVTANIDNGGEITGGMARGIENVADFSGVLLDSDGSGEWTDALGCYGTVSFERIIATGSHEENYIHSVFGRAFIVRGIRTIPVKAGISLNVGDVVSVEEGSAVSLQLSSGLLRISEKTKFEVPENNTDIQETSSNTSLLKDTIWQSLKNVIQGPVFEIKTPTAVAGVRG